MAEDSYGLMLTFKSPREGVSLVFDDDGKVAYAYLKDHDAIVGDVWLYNRCETPDSPEWGNREMAPFANSREYVCEKGRLLEPLDVADVLVGWEIENDNPVAYIYIKGDLFGVVGVGDKPGYARHAAKDSRLAKVMIVED